MIADSILYNVPQNVLYIVTGEEYIKEANILARWVRTNISEVEIGLITGENVY